MLPAVCHAWVCILHTWLRILHACVHSSLLASLLVHQEMSEVRLTLYTSTHSNSPCFSFGGCTFPEHAYQRIACMLQCVVQPKFPFDSPGIAGYPHQCSLSVMDSSFRYSFCVGSNFQLFYLACMQNLQSIYICRVRPHMRLPPTGYSLL